MLFPTCGGGGGHGVGVGDGIGTEVGVGWIDIVVLVAAVSVAVFDQHGAEFVSAASNLPAMILSYQPFQAYQMWQNQANPGLGLS